MARVTASMETRNFLENVMMTKNRLDTDEAEMSSGKKVNKLSDDPYAASQSINIAAQSAANDKYISNNDQLTSKLEMMDTTVQAAIDNLDSVKSVVAQALSGTTTDSTNESLSGQIDDLRAQFLSLGNQQYNGSYLFSGTMTSTTPFVDSGSGVVYQGNDEAIMHRLDGSTTIQSNITGQELFMDDPGLFDTLDQLQTDIENGDTTAINSDLDNINEISTRFNTYGSQIGNSEQMVTQVQSQLNAQNTALQTQDSSLVDANMVESASNFTLDEQALETSLSAQAKIQQVSLIDYLG